MRTLLLPHCRLTLVYSRTGSRSQSRAVAQAARHGTMETKEACWAAYGERCRGNLHIVLALSPAGERLRARCRNFPGLATSTVINWFQPWPEQALHSVAASLLQVRRIIFL